MNTWVQNMVQSLDSLLSEFSALDPNNWPKEQPYLLAQKHYLNQAEYVFDNQIQIIKHILYYETMQKDFNSLMKLYNLNIELPDKACCGINTRDKYSQLSHLDLQPDTIAIINYYARVDFE